MIAATSSGGYPVFRTADAVGRLEGGTHGNRRYGPGNSRMAAQRQSLKLERTHLPGLVILEPERFGDQRGFFAETWNQARMESLGLSYDFVQDNHSLSAEAGTIRGLHYQAPPCAQAKLVRCGRGRLFDVAVDICARSSTYGQWFGVELSSDNGKQLLIPEGFLHGFATCEPDTEIIYKCSTYYAPDCEGVVRFDDPQIGIDWPLDGREPILSEKDAAAPSFRDLDSPFVWNGT